MKKLEIPQMMDNKAAEIILTNDLPFSHVDDLSLHTNRSLYTLYVKGKIRYMRNI